MLRYRARASHLDEKLPAGSFAAAAWGGLQDSIPRAGVMSLHARVEGTQPDSWEDPSVVQIWFRGGADYIVPRADAGVFTLGSYPRDPEDGRRLETLADDIHRVTEGRTLRVAEVSERLRLAHQTHVRGVAVTGRVHIRWDASNIWLIPVERPAIDVGDARRELARRFSTGTRRRRSRRWPAGRASGRPRPGRPGRTSRPSSSRSTSTASAGSSSPPTSRCSSAANRSRASASCRWTTH